MKLNLIQNTRKHIAAIAAVALIGSAALAAEDSPANKAPGEEREVTLADVVVAIEKLNERLEARDKPRDNDEHDIELNMGGGPRFDFRWFPEMTQMNSYLATRGSYAAFPSYMLPMVNSGGGTWRLEFAKYFQIGWNSWGGGFQSHGYRVATERDTIDEDAAGSAGAGYDDFHSYASWGVQVNQLVFQFKVPVVQQALYLGVGGLVGCGEESFSIASNKRSVIDGLVHAVAGTNDWSRNLFTAGGYATIQFQPNRKNDWFKISLNGGYEWYTPIGSWMPSAGVHKDVSAPPAAFDPSNAWIGIGIDFNL